jgi:hypothetical protein
MGYLNLTPSLVAAFSSHLLPVELGPAAPTLIGLLLQLLPFAVILWGCSYLWRTWWQRGLACLVLLFTPTAHLSLWAATLQSMSFFALASYVVLAEDTRGPLPRGRVLLQRAVLVVGGLTGPLTVFLAPFFAAKALWERSREAWLQAGLIVAVAALQSGIFLSLQLGGQLDRTRIHMADPPVALSSAIYGNVALPLLGPAADPLIRSLGVRRALAPGSPPAARRNGLLISLGVLAAALTVLIPLRRPMPRWLLLGAALFSSTLTAFTSHGGGVHSRYLYVPGVMITLLLLDNLVDRDSPAHRLRWLVTMLLLGLGLWAGWGTYWHPPDEPWVDARPPAWSQQVAAWRADPHHQLAGYPEIFPIALQRRNIAHDLHRDIEQLQGQTLDAGQPAVSIPVRGLPVNGVIELRVDNPAALGEPGLELILSGEDGAPLARDLLRPERSDAPGRLLNRQPREPSLMDVRRLTVRLPDGLAGPVRIESARWRDSRSPF